MSFLRNADLDKFLIDLELAAMNAIKKLLPSACILRYLFILTQKMLYYSEETWNLPSRCSVKNFQVVRKRRFLDSSGKKNDVIV